MAYVVLYASPEPFFPKTFHTFSAELTSLCPSHSSMNHVLSQLANHTPFKIQLNDSLSMQSPYCPSSLRFISP